MCFGMRAVATWNGGEVGEPEAGGEGGGAVERWLHSNSSCDTVSLWRGGKVDKRTRGKEEGKVNKVKK